MNIKQFYIYLANLDPPFGAEPGKIPPVVVVQTDFLNSKSHLTTLVCPLTSNIHENSIFLRVHLSKSETNLREASDILVDQIRSIDNRRFIKEIGRLNVKAQEQLIRNLQIVLFE